MEVFEFDSYKKYIQFQTNQPHQRGFISKLAKAAGCSHSYLSQVLSGKPDLTPDQAFAIARYFNLDEDHREYFFTLVLHERASTPDLRKSLKEKLETLKQARFQTTKVSEKSAKLRLKQEQLDYYYAAATVGAIHTLTSIESCQTLDAIASRLHIDKKLVEQHLNWLLNQGLVKKVGNTYKHSGESLHLPTESIHNLINHSNWRTKALDDSKNKSSVHYTSHFTVSKKDSEILKTDLIKFLDEQRKQIHKSGSEEMMVFCCDLFKI